MTFRCGIRTIAPVVAIAPLLLVPVGAEAAAKPPKPVVSLTVPAQSDENAPIPISWGSSALPRGTALYLQRQVGTGKVWKNARRLAAPSGSASIDPRALGTYPVRVVALKQGKILASKGRILHVYGKVPFKTLLAQTEGTYVGPTFSFSYAVKGDVGSTAGALLTVDGASNHCKSVHVDAVTKTGTAPLTLTVIQEAGDPVTTTIAIDAVSGVDAAFVPGKSWGINVGSAEATRTSEFFINGSAMCERTDVLKPGLQKV